MVGWPKQFLGFDFNDGAIGLGGLLSASISCYQLYPTPPKKALTKPPQHKEVFQRRPHNGKLSDSAASFTKLVAEMKKGQNPEDEIITEANIAEKRIQIDGYVQFLHSNNKDFFDKVTPLCDTTEFEIPVD